MVHLYVSDLVSNKRDRENPEKAISLIIEQNPEYAKIHIESYALDEFLKSNSNPTKQKLARILSLLTEAYGEPNPYKLQLMLKTRQDLVKSVLSGPENGEELRRKRVEP